MIIETTAWRLALISLLIPLFAGWTQADEIRATAQVVGTDAGAVATATVRQLNAGGRAQATQVSDEDPLDDIERIVFLTSGGPLIVELKLTLDGEPFRAARERLVDEMLRTVDPKNEGNVSWEAALANPRFLFGRLGYVSQNKDRLPALLKQFDLNGDTMLDRAETRQALSRSFAGGAFAFYPYGIGTQTGDLRPLLDPNRDGMISSEELKLATKNLKKQDANDNDLLELAELNGTQPRRASPTSGLFQLGRSANLVALSAALKQRYANPEGRILAESFTFAGKLFQQLDLNQNGELDSGEAILFHIARPQLELAVQIGQDAATSGVQFVRADDELGDHGQLVRQDDGSLRLKLPGLTLSFLVMQGVDYGANFSRSAQAILQQYDFDKNGYLEKSELKKNLQNAYFALQFDRWDADGDGKVFEAELIADYETQMAPQKTQVSLRFSEQGPALFEELDASGDRRLSLREMRLAEQRLLNLDQNGDRAVSADEMPSQFQVALGRGNSIGLFQAQQGGGVNGNRPKTISGPSWFVRMDRNGDGDLTPREFLGTAEMFAKFDRNQDGLLEPAEAEALATEASPSESPK